MGPIKLKKHNSLAGQRSTIKQNLKTKNVQWNGESTKVNIFKKEKYK